MSAVERELTDAMTKLSDMIWTDQMGNFMGVMSDKVSNGFPLRLFSYLGCVVGSWFRIKAKKCTWDPVDCGIMYQKIGTIVNIHLLVLRRYPGDATNTRLFEAFNTGMTIDTTDTERMEHYKWIQTLCECDQKNYSLFQKDFVWRVEYFVEQFIKSE